MTRGAWRLVGADAMRALDRHTIDVLGVPGEVLMESAGRAVAEAVLRERARREPRGGEVVVVCGAGNNGGDGFVVARLLRGVGLPARVVHLGDADALRGDARANAARAEAAGVVVSRDEWTPPAAGVVVDAIFGTGLTRPLEGVYAEAVRRINTARAASRGALAVVSVDMPSGVCTDTGRILGEAIEADVTVTVELPKPGLALEPGRSLAGAVEVASIGIAHDAAGAAVATELWTPESAASALPERPAAGHKGSFGHVLLVAGSEGKTGAAALAAHGAGRSGAGLVTLACPAGLNDVLEQKCTEAMTVPVPDTEARSFAASAADPVLALAATRSAVGLGPGLSRDPEAGALAEALVKRLECPLAIDADGLFPFNGESHRLSGRSAPTVITPHPGEAAALLGGTAAELNDDRLGAARRLASQTGTVVLLKGAASVTAAPDGRAAVNPSGGPNLGTGGTGDVLLGMVTAFLAQAVPAFEAAALAAYVHGLAGDRIAERSGRAGLMATDLAAEIPVALEALRREAAGDARRELRLARRFP